MDIKKRTQTQSNRHLKLSLKKNKLKADLETKKHSRSSDVIILDESLDRYQLEAPKHLMTDSPIVVNDSSILFEDDLPAISLSDKEPSRNGNVSFNCSLDIPSVNHDPRPSIGGWSPAQHIIAANPQNDLIPSTPKDVANESYEHCSIKTIEESHKKILNELYGDTWKSIPSLFKTKSHKHYNFDGITKKLFPDDDEKPNHRKVFERERNLYLTRSADIRKKLANGDIVKTYTDVKKKEADSTNTEKKCKKKLYTEKVPSTPNLPTQKIKIYANSTTKKVKITKSMTVTDLVKILSKDDDVKSKEDIAVVPINKIENDIRVSKKEENILTNKENNLLLQGNYLTSKKKELTRKQTDFTGKENGNDFTRKATDFTRKATDFTRKANDLARKENDLPRKNNEFTGEGEIFYGGKTTGNVDILTKRIENVSLTPKNDVKRLSFVGSLAENVPSWRCHYEALQYRDGYKNLREQLARRLYSEFNRDIFGEAMPADMAILWDTKLRRTAGTTTNRLVKNAKGDRIRTSVIKLSTKVVDNPQRLRDTLVHEMCHAATWLVDLELRAGHGPLWKKWATRALRVFPELGEISRCHDMEIHFKYCFRCTKCGYSIQRHSKSIDITKKCCGYCRGRFEIVINKKNQNGVVTATPARKAPANAFALYVKENYANVKDGTKTHAQVMKILGEQYSAMKNKAGDTEMDS